MEPATRWLDESFAPLLNSDERFARQHRIKSIHQCFHWLRSHQAKIAIFRVLACMLSTQSPLKRNRLMVIKKKIGFFFCNSFFFPLKITFITPSGILFPIGLACMLNSLVRVSRRDELVHHWNQHFFFVSFLQNFIRKVSI